MDAPRPRARRESHAERRTRRAEIDDPEVVLAAALRYLEVRARSVHETRRRLTEAGYRHELVDGAVTRLLAIGLLDDDTFARHWIESRDRARPRGELVLRRELRLRGVDGAVIEAALEARRAGEADYRLGTASPSEPAEDVEREDPDETAARRLVARRRRDLERIADPRKRRAKAYALLARNGFPSEIAARLAAEVASAEWDPSADEP